jgi:hypothetical protein
MASWQGYVVVLGTSALVIGCSGADKAPDSTVESGNSGGSAGAAGSAGSFLLGNGGSMAGAGGSAPLDTGPPPTITFHACGMPEPACDSKVLTGDVVIDGLEDQAALQGVTAIVGKLNISFKTVDTLGCLESVSGDVTIDVSVGDGDASLWGLRHLKSIGGELQLSNSLDRTYADCGLSELERVEGGGGIEATDLGAELDLSHLLAMRELKLSNTELTRIKLPLSGSFALARVEISNNPYLSALSGFDDVVVSPLAVASAETVRIVNNPRLSDCVAKRIGQRFVMGGAEQSTVTTFGNLPCPME